MNRAARTWRNLAIGAVYCLSLVSYSQTDVPDKATIVQQMRSLYYTPTAAGLRSFSCEAKPDWRSILQQDMHKDIAIDDRLLSYLNQVKITFKASLEGTVNVDGISPTGSYPASYVVLDRINAGAQSMLQALLQQWIEFLNGKFMPTPEEDFRLQHTDDGYRLTLTGGTKTGHQAFSPDYLMNESRVTEGGQNVDLIPTFAKTRQGFLLTRLAATFGSSGSAPNGFVMRPEYQTVGAYQIPGGLSATFQNTAQIDFTFTDCQINQDAPGLSGTAAATSN
jgi:hypothetical protein